MAVATKIDADAKLMWHVRFTNSKRERRTELYCMACMNSFVSLAHQIFAYRHQLPQKLDITPIRVVDEQCTRCGDKSKLHEERRRATFYSGGGK